MNAVKFPEANCKHTAPAGMDESHVKTIPSFKAQIDGGPFDGDQLVVVAWQPSPEELAQLNAGGLVYLSMLGGLSPHFISTSFAEATKI